MKKILSTFALSAFLLSATMVSTLAQAEMTEYTFDKAHTQVMFSVSHMGYSFSHGRFTDIDGGFSFDPENVTDSTIDVTIPTDSLEMDDADWNKHLKNADFFNVEKHPTMTFKSKKIEKTDDNTGVVTGDLTLLGITKSVVLDVTWNKTDIHPHHKRLASGFSATGKLKRSDFKMNYGIPNVGDKVNIKIQVEGTAKTDPVPEEVVPEIVPEVTPDIAPASIKAEATEDSVEEKVKEVIEEAKKEAEKETIKMPSEDPMPTKKEAVQKDSGKTETSE